MSEIIAAIKRLERRERRHSATFSNIPLDGWLPSMADTWVYASATTFVIEDADASGRYRVGMFVKFTQSSTVKYGCITDVSYSSPDTTITIAGDSVANDTIEDNYVSASLSPLGADLTNFDVDQLGSGDATDGHMLTADGAGGAAWEALADHDHSGDAGDGGQLDPEDVLTSGSETQSSMLCADGLGGVQWSKVPDHSHDGTSGQGGTFEVDNLDATGVTDGYVLTADGSSGCGWEALPAAVQDYDVVIDTNTRSTTSTSLTDLTGASITVTASADALILLFASIHAYPASGQNVTFIITDSSNNQVSNTSVVYFGTSGSYATLFAIGYKAVSSGDHTFKIRWMVSGGTGQSLGSSMRAVVLAR